MKQFPAIFTLLLSFLIQYGCTTNNQLSQTENPSEIPLNSNPDFMVGNLSATDKSKISSQTQKIYNRYIKALDEKEPDKFLVYSQLVDVPDKTTYTALGNMLGNVDTQKIKSKGFVNRRIKDLPYLHKRQIDRTRKVISSEYLFKTDSGYFYLFSYAPVRHLIENEEDIIIAQDSLNRKSTGLITSLGKK